MPYEQLKPADKEMFRREILEMTSQILDRKKENVVIDRNLLGIQKALESKIMQHESTIEALKIEVEDFKFDLKNDVTITALQSKLVKNLHEIKRLEGNIKVRENQINQGVLRNPSRDQRAREKFKKEHPDLTGADIPPEEENVGQSETEEAGQEESGDKPEA